MSHADSAARIPHHGDPERHAAGLRKAHFDAEFARFVDHSYLRAERVLRSRCRDRDMVREALHEAYLTGRTKWADVRVYEEPLGWLIMTARHKLMHEWARLRRQATHTIEDVPPASLAEHADAWEAQEMLRGWLQQLPPRHAEVFQMSQEGFDNSDIARILCLADTSVRSYKTAAKRRMRELAQEAGFTAPSQRRRPGGGRHESR